MQMTIQVNYAAAGCLPDSDNYPYEIQVDDLEELTNVIRCEVEHDASHFDVSEREIKETARQIWNGQVDSWPIPTIGEHSTYILEVNVIHEERAFDL